MHNLIIIPLLLILTACGTTAEDKPPVPAVEPPPEMQGDMMVLPFPGRVIGNIDKSNFPEPSGIVFHPLRETLFVVGDEGDLGEMKIDGTPLRKKHYPAETFRMDFTGIAVNPLTGLLYVAVDSAGNIYIAQDSGGILKIEWTNQLKND